MRKREIAHEISRVTLANGHWWVDSSVREREREREVEEGRERNVVCESLRGREKILEYK